MMLQIPIRRLATAGVVAVLLVVAVPSLALGHAELDTPTPADKSTVTEPVAEVSGTFTQRVKVDGSKLLVKDASGTTVAQGGRDPDDAKRMVAVPQAPLGPGTYLVEWTTISRDDDELARGTWTFTVAVAPTPSPTPVASAVPSANASAAASAAPTPSPLPSPTAPAATPSPSADGGTTGSGGDVVLPIVIALIVLGAGAAYLFSRRGRPAPDA